MTRFLHKMPALNSRIIWLMKNNATVEADSMAIAYYQFTVTEPELTSSRSDLFQPKYIMVMTEHP